MPALENPKYETDIGTGIEPEILDHAHQPDFTLIPSDEKGFFSPDHLKQLPKMYIKGLGGAALSVANHYISGETSKDWPEPDRRLIRVKDHERLILITDPKPENCDDPDNAINDVLLPGLSEMDIGSALLLHKAKAERHQDRRVITLPTLGVSITGQVLSIKEGYQRSLEETAADNLELLPTLTANGKTNLVGTSLGSYVSTLMAAQNLAANGHSQLNLDYINLIATAVGARNIPDDEKFHHVDAGDEDFINEVTRRFFRHMPVDTARMAFNHPEMAAECAAVLGAYAMHLNKTPQRLAAMLGNLRGVRKGVDWEDLKDVARGYEIHVLGGEKDPLMKEQIPQWSAIKALAPHTQVRVLLGSGHALTIDSHGTAEHLAQMEIQSDRIKNPLQVVN